MIEYYNLPTFHYINSGSPRSWHAYCLARLSFEAALYIALRCRYVDRVYCLMALRRGYFTLRFTNKKGRKFGEWKAVYSDVPDQASFDELKYYYEYLTPRKKEVVQLW